MNRKRREAGALLQAAITTDAAIRRRVQQVLAEFVASGKLAVRTMAAEDFHIPIPDRG